MFLIGRGIIWNSGGTIFISPQIPQGEYYNADEVQAMVAAEMLEEKRKKQEEEDMFDDIGAEAGQVDRNFFVARVASEKWNYFSGWSREKEKEGACDRRLNVSLVFLSASISDF